MATAPTISLPAVRGVGRDEVIQRAAILALIVWLVITVLLPLYALLSKSFQNADAQWVGLDNYIRYFATPALMRSLWNSLAVSLLVTFIVVPIAFLFAYALTRSRMPLKPLFQAAALIPILAPSLLPAIALIYLFGNQGIFRAWFPDGSIYGVNGIIIAQCFYCFPHALMILVTALSTADGRLYEAANALGASRWRIFWTVTLPGARYGVISTCFVVFTLVITDFGIAKVIGGQFNVLATDIYKQVIGQQSFEMGAVVGMVLLAPALLSFAVDRIVQKKQVALLSARAVPHEPKPRFARDALLFLICLAVAGFIVGVLAIAAWGSVIKYWPYNLALTLDNYVFSNFIAGGWQPYWTSLQMAAAAAVVGTALVFLGAYLVEKSRKVQLVDRRSVARDMWPILLPVVLIALLYASFVLEAGFLAMTVIGLGAVVAVGLIYVWGTAIAVLALIATLCAFFVLEAGILGMAAIGLGAVVAAALIYVWGTAIAHFLAMIPLAVPGLVLGLGYIFFFNAKGNPLNFLYGTLAILVINTIAHFYTVAHLTAVTALKQIDNEFEAVSASLKVPFYVTFSRVTLPICVPAILDIAIYIFVNTMTTVSAVIFLYAADTMPASVMVVHMEEAGQTAAAAAMGTLIVATSAAVKLLQLVLGRFIDRRTQAWRRR